MVTAALPASSLRTISAGSTIVTFAFPPRMVEFDAPWIVTPPAIAGR